MNEGIDNEPAVLLYTWTKLTSGAPGRARAVLRRALREAGVAEDTVDDAVLAASELVANATEHAIGPYELLLRRMKAELICEVRDGHPHIPAVADVPEFPAADLFLPEPEGRGGGLDALAARLRERGRGLRIVHQLTNGAWGFRRLEDGTKLAWMAIPRTVSALERSSPAAGECR